MRKLPGVLIFLSFGVLYVYCNDLEGYKKNEATGHAYKLMYKAENWTVAEDSCASEGAKLAVPKSKEEFQFLQKIVRGMRFPDVIGAEVKLIVWLGINNLEYYKVWKNVDGEDIENTGFHEWSGDYGLNPRPEPREPHCVGMDAHNPGLRDWWCHRAQAYICEKKI